MHRTTRFVVAAWLAAAAGCSDDGIPAQGLNSSGTGVDTVPGESTGNGTNPTTGEDQGGTGNGTGTGPADGDTQGGPDTDTSGPPPADGSTSVATDDGSTVGTTEATGTTEGSPTTGEVCDPITEDPSGIGVACRGDLDCLEGYTCQPFNGLVFQQTCQILCTMDCECPMGLACVETVDKLGIPWFQCT